MSNNHRRFVWYELMTSDTQAAEAFYCKVMGWTARDSGMTDLKYTLISMGAAVVGGLMTVPDEARSMGARPVWMGYIGVDDVDAFAGRVSAAGGTVQRPPEDIPGVGRFAVVADPQGASFVLFQGAGDDAPAAVAPGTPGHVGWHELHAGNGDSAFAFYSSLFGWTPTEAMDMGPLGSYQIFAVNGVPCGGMMTKMAQTPLPGWLYYFNVEAVDAAMKRVTDNGGSVIQAPQQVPGGSWIVQCTDPQGAMFAMVGAARAEPT